MRRSCKAMVLCVLSVITLICLYIVISKSTTYKPYTFTKRDSYEPLSYVYEQETHTTGNVVVENNTSTVEVGSYSHDSIKLPIHNQEDPQLIEYVRSQMVPPSPKDSKYNLKINTYDPSEGQASVVRQLLNFKKGGFFVECGGGDGEFYSNTLFLEKDMGWTGLLVEADPQHIVKLLQVNRKAWFIPACMSLNTSAYQTTFETSNMFWGKISDVITSKSTAVSCFPFYTLMMALNVTKVDYFSLDVEGHEVEILESIPFNKVDISVLSVEFDKSRGGKKGVIDTLGMRGYKVAAQVPKGDLIFVKRDHEVNFFV